MGIVNSTHSLILRRLATLKNETVAREIGHDGGHVSRIASGERGVRLPELESFLTALGLAVVEMDGPAVTMSMERAKAIELLAMEALRREVK
jgi:hypothetical protein